MGLLYQRRRLKVNKVKRRIAANRAALQRIRVLLSIIMVLLISFLGIKVLKMPQWYINMDKLSKADPSVLTIKGNLITPDYKIINMIRQTQLPYTQIFRLDTTELVNNISQLQPVKKVYVRRYWFPARLVITIDERTPAFLLAPNLESEPNSVLSVDGILIDRDYLPFDPSIKAKKLLTYGVQNGHDEVWDKKRVDEILRLIKALEAYSNWQVQYIDFRQPDIYIKLDDYLIRLGKIDETTQKRAKKIASIIPKLKEYKNIKYIDLRWEDSTYFRLEGDKEIRKPINVASDKKELVEQAAKSEEETQQSSQPQEEQSEEESER